MKPDFLDSGHSPRLVEALPIHCQSAVRLPGLWAFPYLVKALPLCPLPVYPCLCIPACAPLPVHSCLCAPCLCAPCLCTAACAPLACGLIRRGSSRSQNPETHSQASTQGWKNFCFVLVGLGMEPGMVNIDCSFVRL